MVLQHFCEDSGHLGLLGSIAVVLNGDDEWIVGHAESIVLRGAGVHLLIGNNIRLFLSLSTQLIEKKKKEGERGREKGRDGAE